MFLIYINDLEEGVTSKIWKFADDTKLFRKIKGNGDKQQLQYDIDKLIKWSEKWQMLFNFQKCKCLHAGHGKTGVNYEMGGTILCQTVKENDLGVTINANMKVSEHCRIAASQGNQILGMIRRNITYRKDLISGHALLSGPPTFYSLNIPEPRHLSPIFLYTSVCAYTLIR